MRSDIPEILRASEVVLLPSIYGENLPTVLMEAGGCGRPVVASDVGGISDIVADRETGLLVRPGDAAGIADAVVRLLDDRDLRRGDGPAPVGSGWSGCSTPTAGPRTCGGSTRRRWAAAARRRSRERSAPGPARAPGRRGRRGGHPDAGRHRDLRRDDHRRSAARPGLRHAAAEHRAGRDPAGRPLQPLQRLVRAGRRLAGRAGRSIGRHRAPAAGRRPRAADPSRRGAEPGRGLRPGPAGGPRALRRGQRRSTGVRPLRTVGPAGAAHPFPGRSGLHGLRRRHRDDASAGRRFAGGDGGQRRRGVASSRSPAPIGRHRPCCSSG